MHFVDANGAHVPVLGFGTWQLRGEAAVAAVMEALQAGYRHIDTAAMYGNESEVGEAIRRSGIPREALFVTTKVWHSDLAEARLLRSAETSLRRLGLEQVDLLLIHWPSREMPLADQMGALCTAKKKGLARHIGISNFPPRYVEEAARIADEPLVTNQVEHHPYLDQSALLEVCARHGLALTSYSPLGRGAMLREPAIVEVARAKGKTPGQVVLRWHVQLPMNIAIPKSADRKRIAENIDIFDFELTADEMARISALASPRGRVVGSATGLAWDAVPA